MKTLNFLFTYIKSIEKSSSYSLYAIHHYLIHILRLFHGFFYLILVISSCQISCLQSPMIELQRVFQQFQQFSQFKLCIISQVSNCVFTCFQQSQVLVNAYLIFFYYHIFLNRVLFRLQWVFPCNMIVFYYNSLQKVT